MSRANSLSIGYDGEIARIVGLQAVLVETDVAAHLCAELMPTSFQLQRVFFAFSTNLSCALTADKARFCSSPSMQMESKVGGGLLNPLLNILPVCRFCSRRRRADPRTDGHLET